MSTLCCAHSRTLPSEGKGLAVGPHSSWQSNVLGVSVLHTAVPQGYILRCASCGWINMYFVVRNKNYYMLMLDCAIISLADHSQLKLCARETLYLSCCGSKLLLLLLSGLSPCYWVLTTLRKIILSSLGAFYILNYNGEMHSWCNWHEWSYTGDHFSSTNVVQMLSHCHTFQLKIMQNEIFWYFRFTCSGEKIWRRSIRIHGITAASNQISNIGW